MAKHEFGLWPHVTRFKTWDQSREATEWLSEIDQAKSMHDLEDFGYRCSEVPERVLIWTIWFPNCEGPREDPKPRVQDTNSGGRRIRSEEESSDVEGWDRSLSWSLHSSNDVHVGQAVSQTSSIKVGTELWWHLKGNLKKFFWKAYTVGSWRSRLSCRQRWSISESQVSAKATLMTCTRPRRGNLLRVPDMESFHAGWNGQRQKLAGPQWQFGSPTIWGTLIS